MYKTISDFPDYEVDENGNVRHKGKAIILKPRLSKAGYFRVNINGKTVHIHRLVAMTFLPNPHGFTQINHIDEDKANNHVSNLEWCTVKYNNSYGTRQQKCDYHRGKQIVSISDRGEIRKYMSTVEAARELGVNPSSIWQALQSGNRTCKGLHWRYETGKTNKAVGA